MQTHDSNGTCAINRDDFALNDDNVASISPPPFLADRSSSLSDRTFYPLPTLASQHLSLKPLGSLDVLNIGKKKFNLSPDSGIQFLQEYGYFSPPPLSPKEIAQFLIAESETLSKASIGQYFGGENSNNISVMQEFLKAQSFENVQFDDALRRFLSTFRLPGEAQKIDRIMNEFARRFLECNPDNLIFNNVDTAYVLAFSIIMLNTDLHNPSVKTKIKRDTFIKNNLSVLADISIHQPPSSTNFLPKAITPSSAPSQPSKTSSNTLKTYLEIIYDSILLQPLSLGSGHEDDPMISNLFNFTFCNPEREGWLIKRGGRIKTWKQRYCILTGSCLYYLKSNDRTSTTAPAKNQSLLLNNNNPCGIIPLENLLVCQSDVAEISSFPTHKFGFKLQYLAPNDSCDLNMQSFKSDETPSEGKYPSINHNPTCPIIKAVKARSDGRFIEGHHESYEFACETEDECTDWIHSIRAQMSQPPLLYFLYNERLKQIKRK